LYVGVSQPRQKALEEAGEPVPPPVLIQGLIDTGASATAIDPSIIQGLKLQQTGSLPIHTPSTGHVPHQASTYDVCITIPFDGVTFTLGALQVFESSLSVQGIQALIGRDVLANCLFVYDGRANIFSIAF
jgi:predicted aspartyl protease